MGHIWGYNTPADQYNERSMVGESAVATTIPPMRPSHFPIGYNPLEELPLDLSMPGTSTQQGASQGSSLVTSIQQGSSQQATPSQGTPSQGTPSPSQQGSSRQRAVYTDTPRPGTSRNLEIMDESPRGTANISTFLEEGEIMKGDSPKTPKTPPPIISPLKRGGNRTRRIPSKRMRRSLFF